MGLLDNIFETKPDFVNGIGIKWWLDKSCTEYAQEEDLHGISLPNVRVYDIEETNGNRTRVIIEDGEVVFDNPRLEDIGVRIDIMKVAKQMQDK